MNECSTCNVEMTGDWREKCRTKGCAWYQDPKKRKAQVKTVKTR